MFFLSSPKPGSGWVTVGKLARKLSRVRAELWDQVAKDIQGSDQLCATLVVSSDKASEPPHFDAVLTTLDSISEWQS